MFFFNASDMATSRESDGEIYFRPLIFTWEGSMVVFDLHVDLKCCSLSL